MASYIPSTPPKLLDPSRFPGGSKMDLGSFSHPTLAYKISTETFVSANSAQPPSTRLLLQVRNENNAALDWKASSSENGGEPSIQTPISRKVSSRVSRLSSWGTDIPPPPHPRGSNALEEDAGQLEEVDLNAGCSASNLSEENNTWTHFNGNTKLKSAMDAPISASTQIPTISVSHARQPFQKWMKSLRSRNARSRSVHTIAQRLSLDDQFDEIRYLSDAQPLARSHHKKSSSFSSMAFVTAVKSASVSIGSASMAPRSRGFDRPPHLRHRSGTRSSEVSNAETKLSMDENCLALIIDAAVSERAVRRQKIIEELIHTEEEYIADMKMLMNVYFTYLASITTLPQQACKAIHSNMTEILQLHQDLLEEIYRVVPSPQHSSEQISNAVPGNGDHFLRGHSRWHSFDGALEQKNEPRRTRVLRRSADLTRQPLAHPIGSISDPHVAANISKVFDKLMNRFFAYEEYGAQYEMMVKHVESTDKPQPSWATYEKGIESLANALSSINSRETEGQKGQTFSDLVIKPIQRVCRYPLLFADLCKNTPVYDCPESHAQLDKVFSRLRETAREINNATGDQKLRDRIEKTWILQDRLVFGDQVGLTFSNLEMMQNSNSVAFKYRTSDNAALRQLGHILLCGVLHIAYQGRCDISGEYMICLLFQAHFVLATIKKGDSIYKYAVVACISIGDVKIEPLDNGTGLQCHTVSFSWKMIFESDHHLYEMIFSACSAQEEAIWKGLISERACAHISDSVNSRLSWLNPPLGLAIDIKPIGQVFGQIGTLARRISVHRAATFGPKTSLSHVVIRNTHALKDAQDAPSPLASQTISRSQSLLSTNRLPILAPKRSERVRLEVALADVWTKDELPFPGMCPRRGEHHIRASASSMMRKLSMATITTSFSKRTPSYASISSVRHADQETEETQTDGSPTDESAKSLEEVKYTLEETCPLKVSKKPHNGSLRGSKKAVSVQRLDKSDFNRTKTIRQKGDEGAKAKSALTSETKRAKTMGKREHSRRWSNPGGLAKTFSAEGMRRLFV
ncbi:MAG: hypothetical protein M1829_002759 [Trizodia sp. TS-e1964]|nr:MAG: hypothetical protein M1829_002759 [Trizodia sp. TS-e1964]